MRESVWMLCVCVALVLAGCADEEATVAVEGSESGAQTPVGDTVGSTPGFPDASMGTLSDTEGSDVAEAVDTEVSDAAAEEDVLVEDVQSLSDVEDVEESVEDDSLTPEPDTTVTADGGTGSEGGGMTTTGCKTHKTFDWPEQSGVAYVAHYHTDELRWYRTDGEFPYQEGVINTGGLAHAMALEPVLNLIAVAHDMQRTVEIFQLTRPASPADPVPAPVLVATLEMGDYAPRAMVFDSIRERLYVATNAPIGDELLSSMWLHVYDIGSPELPLMLTGPQEIPVTVELAFDPYAGVLGLVSTPADKLHIYKAHDAQITPIFGNEISISNLYSEDSSTGLQVRGLRFDPENGRILAARAQSAVSEVIAFSYPTVVGSDEECPGLFDMDDLEMIPDGFDVSQAPADWDNLLGAFGVLPIPGTDAVMFIVNAWNGSQPSAAVMPLDGSLSPQVGCGDYAGTGCFYQPFFNGSASGYSQTDGAACLDAAHNVVVGTSYDAGSEDSAGGLHFFRYEEDLTMTKWASESGGHISASGLPIEAVCH